MDEFSDTEIEAKFNLLDRLFRRADMFVISHYTLVDQKDKSIKILATMNQIIELKKLKQSLPDIEWVPGNEMLVSDMVPIKKREQKGQ